MILFVVLSFVWAALAVTFLFGLAKVYFHRQQLTYSRSTAALPALSIIVPARNEAVNIGRCLDHLVALRYPSTVEVIVVDDNSTDSTADVVAGYVRSGAPVRLVTAGPLPDGWTGKSHACWQGVRSAIGDWLLFIDADTFLEQDAAVAAIQHALNERLQFLSVVPFQQIVSFQERVVLPGVFLGFGAVTDFDRVNDPDDSFVIANGQFLLFARAAYEKLGGHQAIRHEVSDDLAFAKRVKEARVRGYTIFGEALVETRMYRSLKAIWYGFSKNAVDVIQANSLIGVLGKAFLSIAVGLGTLVSPMSWIAISASTSLMEWGAAIVSGVTFLVLCTMYGLSLQALRVPLVFVLTVPLGLVMHGAIILNALLHKKKGTREWKGRRY